MNSNSISLEFNPDLKAKIKMYDLWCDKNGQGHKEDTLW